MAPWIVVIGASLGGLRALETVLGSLSSDFVAPIAVVQHRIKSYPEVLATVLQAHTSLTVKDAEDRDVLEPGTVYLAPADYHLLIEHGGRCALSLEAPVKHSRPSVDILFESAADAYRERTIGVVLTGNNSDGADGAQHIKRLGGTVIVQNPEECEAAAMPLATIEAVERVDGILNINEIAPYLIKHCTPAD